MVGGITEGMVGGMAAVSARVRSHYGEPISDVFPTSASGLLSESHPLDKPVNSSTNSTYRW